MLFSSYALHAQNNTVVEIQIAGLKNTKEVFIRKLINLKEGSVLDSLEIEKDVTRLKRLPSISNARYAVNIVQSNGYKVLLEIEENFTLIPFANLFSSSNDDFAFRVGLQEFNLLGRNITLGGFYQYDVFNSYGLNLQAPQLFSNKIGLAINYNNLTTEEPVFIDEETSTYKYNNHGVEILGLYEINFNNRLAFGFSVFNEDYQYLSGATKEGVPQKLRVDKHLFKFLYNYDNIKYQYQYLSGFKSALNLQYVGSSNKNLPTFLIGFNDFNYYKRVGDRGNWASRLRLGLSSNPKTPFAPFTLDNNLNIRGVGNNIDRGTGSVVINTEYRHTIIDKNWFVLQSNVFVDAGSWRNPGGEYNDFISSKNIRVYPGAGFRFIHKKIFNAIFRIDYGYGITDNESSGIVFGIGQYF